MDFFLSNLDNQILQQVKSLTASHVVNKKKESYINKDEAHRERGRESKKKSQEEIREKIEELNKLIEEKRIGFYLIVEELENEEVLLIKVINKNTDSCIRTFNESELDKLIRSLHDVMGIIVDIRI